MQELLKKLKKTNLEEIIKLEETDRQFIAISKIYWKIPDNYFLSLVISNALLAYQLSGSWEDYWEEFSDFVLNYNFWSNLDIKKFFDNFLSVCACNKRLINIKKARINKINDFLEIFTWKEKFFYNNIQEMQNALAKSMKQDKKAKTIVFAIKMFWYAARNIWWFKKYPYDISIPIDSRLEKIYNKYNKNKNLKIEDFYNTISQKTSIPALHLDSFLWINYDKLIK